MRMSPRPHLRCVRKQQPLETDNKAADQEATTSPIAEGKGEDDKQSLGDDMDIVDDVDADEEAARELFE